MSGIPLLEAKKLAQDPLTYAVIDEFSEGMLMGIVPFADVMGTGVHYNRLDKLPGVAFRGYNESHENSYGSVKQESEALKLFGGELDVDRAIVDLQGNQARAAHTLAKVKALRMDWEKTFVKGDSATNPRVFDGLQKRIPSTGTQYVANASAGAALSLNKLDELLDVVKVPGQKYLIMSLATQRLLTAASRNTAVGGFINFEQDQFGRKLAMYGGAFILPVDEDSDGNQILGFSEAAPNGSGTTFTSIYCVVFGGSEVTGIQGAVNGEYGISVRDLGELDNQPVFRTRVDWYNSLVIYNGRAAGRLAGISNATVTA